MIDREEVAFYAEKTKRYPYGINRQVFSDNLEACREVISESKEEILDKISALMRSFGTNILHWEKNAMKVQLVSNADANLIINWVYLDQSIGMDPRLMSSFIAPIYEPYCIRIDNYNLMNERDSLAMRIEDAGNIKLTIKNGRRSSMNEQEILSLVRDYMRFFHTWKLFRYYLGKVSYGPLKQKTAVKIIEFMLTKDCSMPAEFLITNHAKRVLIIEPYLFEVYGDKENPLNGTFQLTITENLEKA